MLTTTAENKWKHSTNIYEVNLRQYTKEGTFAAFVQHLPRLKDMGVEVIWFMPVTPISIKNRKGTLGSYYACSNYVTTNAEFGTLDEFKQLVAEIQQLGMKVIIDWVANHTGWDHEWTILHPDYYSKNNDGSFKPPVENWEDVIHLNFSNEQMRTAMIDAMKFWVQECSIDGFRCDMAMLVPLDFWMQARKYLDAMKPLFWLGEFDQWNDEPYAQAFDVSYSWHWMHISEKFYLQKLKQFVLDHALDGYKRKHPFGHIRSFFTTNHDENSWNGSEYEKYGDMAIPFAVFSCMWDGIPLVYSGQEVANKKRLQFFDKDEIKWSKDEPKLHQFYKTLLHFKKQHPALVAATRTVITWKIATTEMNDLFSFLRKANEREVITILNLTDKKLKFHITDTRVRGVFTNLFTLKEHYATEEFVIKPWGYIILHK